MTIGFIGAGNMGFAMMKGLARKKIDDIYFYDKNKSRCDYVNKNIGVKYMKSTNNVISNAQYIVLAVKPQFYNDVLEDVSKNILPNQIIISIAPGISISSIKHKLGEDIKVVRVMPNTPVLVGEGMSVLSFSDDIYTDKEKEDIFNLFKSFGKIEVLEEKYMNAVVAISGSSPAYAFIMIEAMADAGVLMGLKRDTAYKLASQSLLGSAKMVLNTRTHPAVLKDRVCSPGGTTIEAVSVLENNNFRSSLIEAMKKCYEKAESLNLDK